MKDCPTDKSPRTGAYRLFGARFLAPLFFLLSATLIMAVTDADLYVSGLFYSPAAGWYLAQKNPWYFTYHYGMIPAFSLAAGALLLLIVGHWREKYRRLRKTAWFVLVFLLVGPGLLVNSLLKDHWGRPRPAEIVNFGGEAPYQPCWKMGEAGRGKSFPSGHASVGFFLFAPYFFLRRKHPRLAGAFLALGIGYGMFMGVGRIVQGGHFLSDVIWSGGLVYLTGLLLSRLFRLEEPNHAA